MTVKKSLHRSCWTELTCQGILLPLDRWTAAVSSGSNWTFVRDLQTTSKRSNHSPGKEILKMWSEGFSTYRSLRRVHGCSFANMRSNGSKVSRLITVQTSNWELVNGCSEAVSRLVLRSTFMRLTVPLERSGVRWSGSGRKTSSVTSRS